MDQQEILQAVLQSEELPTLPVVASKLILLMSKEETTLSDIANLVSRDVALSSKILKVSNSAFYSFSQQIGSIQQAVSILGINAVRSLVLSFSFLTVRKGSYQNSFDFKKFWEYSLASAVASKLITEKANDTDPEEVFVSGLLHNLGELIFARTFPEKYAKVLISDSDSMVDRLAIEESVIGSNHCRIGYDVAKQWGFPEALLAPILYHHSPELYNGKNKSIHTTIKAVYLSDLLTNILFSEKPDQYHKQFRKQAKKLLGLSNQDIEDVLDQIHILVMQAGEYFNLTIKNTRSIQEILQEANIRLSLLNLDYDQMNKQLISAKVELEKLAAELESKNRILDNLANVDGLTNVFNHRYFQNVLEQEIDRAIRHDTVLSLLFVDIDHFKNFNDTYGHQTGDFILKEFCITLKDHIRKYDTLARYGGEEFAIILPSTNEEESVSAAEKLRTTIEQTLFKKSDLNIEYQLTASIGISTCRPASEDNFSKSDFISKADKALYEAKNQGRNIVVSWSAKKKWFKF
jgi:two-component system cell cycle response regulator